MEQVGSIYLWEPGEADASGAVSGRTFEEDKSRQKTDALEEMEQHSELEFQRYPQKKLHTVRSVARIIRKPKRRTVVEL